MRIAVSIKSTTFHKGYGGLETQNKVLCEGLVHKGHEVTVFSPKKELEFESKQENGVNYIFVPCIFTRFSFFSKDKSTSWNNRLKDFIKSHNSEKRIDLFVSQSTSGVSVFKNKTDLKLKTVMISHGTKIGEIQTKLNSLSSPVSLIKILVDVPHVVLNFFTVQRDAVHTADKIIAVSNAVKRSLIEETFVEEDKITVIHNGIDEGIFSEIEDNGENPADLFYKERTNMLFVGQISLDKGIDILVNIMKDPRFDNFSLDVVGDGPYLNDIKQIAQDNSLGKKIKFHGKLNYKKVLSYYNPSLTDIFVFPTKRVEGFPMVLVEAMMSSLPIVAFDLGGVSDAVINDETGYLIQQGNIEGFKSRLLELAQNDNLRRKMGESAKIKAITEFTREKMLNNYEAVFMEVKK